MGETFEPLVGAEEGRFDGIERPYIIDEVTRLGGSLRVEQTLARLGAERLWALLHEREFVAAHGAVTGNQAMQKVRTGLEAVYPSGWQVAADNNSAGAMYPHQSLYPADSGPELVRRINNTLRRADQIQRLEGLVEGTERVVGPFASRELALRIWRRLATETRSNCHARYTIAVELDR